MEDAEIKYGLSVTGVVHPDRVLTNAGARTGAALMLTKTAGTGVLVIVVKARLISPRAEREAIASMATLNRRAAEHMGPYAVHACTDIDGFRLLGHALEMALASNVGIVLNLPLENSNSSLIFS